MEDVVKRVEQIEERNRRVSCDKAWETSLTRRGAIAAFTYLCACVLLLVIAPRSAWWLSALVPVLGYILSTLSLPWIRRVWEARQ